METNEMNEMNETTKTALLSALVDRVHERLFDQLNDVIAEELEQLLNERNVADEDGELMYELFGRVYLGYN